MVLTVLEAQNAALRSAVDEANQRKELDAKIKGKADAVQRSADRNRVRVGGGISILCERTVSRYNVDLSLPYHHTLCAEHDDDVAARVSVVSYKPVPSLALQIFELEEEVARLKQAIAESGIEKERLRSLQGMVDTAKRAAEAANAEAKELRARLKRVEAAKAHGGDDFDVRCVPQACFSTRCCALQALWSRPEPHASIVSCLRVACICCGASP